MEKDKGNNSMHQESEISHLKEKHNAGLIHHGNFLIQGWQKSAEDQLDRIKESLEKIVTEKGSLAEAFEIVSYQDIHKKLTLSDDRHIIDAGERVTIAFKFQNRPRSVLRLYFCLIGENHAPDRVYAGLYYQFGRQIAVLTEDVNCDLQIANGRFEAWFSKLMDGIYKDWLNQAV